MFNSVTHISGRRGRRPHRHDGFTTIELALVIVIIVVLAVMIVTTRSGVEQRQRNAERERDVKELRDGLEGYFAANNRYPSLSELNDDTWRAKHLKSLNEGVFRDPSSDLNMLAGKPTPELYAYAATSASGTACGSNNDQQPCTRYTLTASLEGGGSFTKTSLN